MMRLSPPAGRCPPPACAPSPRTLLQHTSPQLRQSYYTQLDALQLGQLLTGTQTVEIKMGKEDAKEDLLGAVAIKPPGWDRTGWEAFRYFLYDPDNGTFLSRTPLSWLKITVFYTIYYSCLAAFWYACLMIFFMTLPEEVEGPKWKQEGSLIGVNPGQSDTI